MNQAILLTTTVLAVFLVSYATAGPKYIVEVIAVVDKPMLDKWINAPGSGSKEKVLEEIKSMYFEVNVMYQSLRAYDLDVEIRLKDVFFPNESLVAEDKVEDKNVVRQMASMRGLSSWVKRNPNITFDHAQYITAYNLKGNSISEAGLANPYSMCSRKRSFSQVEGKLHARMINSLAHEIGHSLGSNHDSWKKPECKNNYIMNKGIDIGSRNRWFFSPCSAKSFKWAVRGRRCLLETTAPPIVSKRFGELVGKNNICKRFYGTRVSHLASWGDKVCNTLRCVNKSWAQKTNTPEGTSCGKSKQCFMGYCVKK